MKKAIFVGSFDPFTIGHANIVERALGIFDELVIGVGVNENKHYMNTTEERVEAIRNLYEGDDRVKVDSYSDFTIDFAARHGARYVVKGVRSVKDFEYEREFAELNKQYGELETVLLISDQKYANISSSIVRLFMSNGRDVTDMLPKKK